MNRISLFILLLLLFTNCKEGKNALRETDKIVKDYSTNLIEAPKKTKIILEIASIRQALEIYQIENEKFPESLSDLPIKIKDTSEYKYNPETGKVTSHHYPNL